MASYPETLQNFADSIEMLSYAILEHVEQQKKTTSVEDIAKGISDLSSLNEVIEETRGNTEEILNLLKKDKKKDKSATLLEKLTSGGGNTKTKGIADGIKSIGLMAGAITALGLSFKIIGGVDFNSVIALSTAMPLMAMAFSTINDSITSYDDAMLATSSMVMMSAGVMASGLLLQHTPQLSIMQLVSAIGISISMGIAMYAMAEAGDNIGADKIASLYAITPVMPIVAGGLTLSGLILANMPSIGMQQILSSIGVGIAMGGAMIPLALAAKVMGNQNTNDMADMGIIMPIIAFGITLSSQILQELSPVEIDLVLSTSFAIAGATVMGALAFKAVDMMKMNVSMAAQGAIILPIIAAGLMVSSHILALGNYDNYPDFDWAAGVSVSMIGALPSVLVYGSLVSSGVGAVVIAGGILGMIAVAGGLTAMSHILALGNYEQYPDFSWAAGVGLAMTGMLPGIIAVGGLIATGIGGLILYAGMEGIQKIAQTVVDISHIVSKGNYTGGPGILWTMGVGAAIAGFAIAAGGLSIAELFPGFDLEDGLSSILKIAEMLPEIAEIIGETGTDKYTGGPGKKWSEGVGSAISAFAMALGAIQPGVFDKLTNMLGFGGNTAEGNLQMIKSIARMLPEIAGIIGETGTDKYTGGPEKEWSEGVGTAIVSFATAISTMADEIDADELTDWLPALTEMSALLPLFAIKMKGLDFSNYPDKNWSTGILEFITGVSGMKNKNVQSTIKNVHDLANAHFRLAYSISRLATSLKNIGTNQLPDLSNIYGGLITLSLIDKTNLENVMGLLENKQAEFTKLLSAVTNVSQTAKENENTKMLNTTATAAVKSTTVSAPVTITKEKEDKSEKLLSELVNLQQQIISIQQQMATILNEIADNTVPEKKIGINF